MPSCTALPQFARILAPIGEDRQLASDVDISPIVGTQQPAFTVQRIGVWSAGRRLALSRNALRGHNAGRLA